VLVVDDDMEIVSMLTDLLDQDGRFVVKSSSTGFDAGMMTREFLPDLLLLDLKLPDVNGNIVCRRIREDRELRHTKIIMVSGVADPEEIKELRQAGADDFIKKPFDVTHLIKRMVELIGT
jgi:DNA-binding response OmpR family regulator